ncbi:MAG: thermonuclease family protein [Magnetococcales bacterium]|nr:thermonuclease family protein [Magnetococcales bacterium]
MTPPAPAVASVPAEPPPPPVDKPAIAVTHRSTPTLAKKSDQPVGKVVGVHYGCGVEIKEEDGTLHRIHLGGIGCTESDNTFGKHVRRSLAAMVFTKQVRVKKMGAEPDGKPSWEVFDPDNSSVNAAMVRGGLAMALDPRFTEMEEMARRERQGMWADLPAPRR